MEASGKFVTKIFILLFLEIILFSTQAFAQPGTINTDFNPGTETNNDVRSLALQQDEKIMRGYCTSYNGTGRNTVAQLDEGTLTGNITVTILGNTAISSIPFTPLTPLPSSYSPKADYTVGSQPREVAVGDMDGDGNLDIIASIVGTNSINVLKGTGTGCFALPQSFPASTSAHGLAVADVNRDGILDVITTNASDFSSSLSVLIGTATGFASAVEYPTSSTPKKTAHLSAKDVNEDGWPDLLVANNNSPGNFSILFNNGNGTFATGIDIASANGPVYYVVADDLNGDSHPDIAIASFVGTASVYLNDGLGNFPTETTYASGAGSHFISLKDLNGDDRPDMIVPNALANTVSVFLNDGFGAFSAPGIYPTESTPTSVSVEDMNNDGTHDIVAGNAGANTVNVFPGDGNGSFGEYQSFATGTSPYNINVGDFDEDGKLDIVSANLSSNNVSVLLTFNTSCVPTITSFTPSSGPIGSTITITGTNFSPISADNITAFNGTVASITSSTTTSIVANVPAGATTGPITVSIGGNTATSATSFTITVCPGVPAITPSTGCQNTSIILTASGGLAGQYRWYDVSTGGQAIAGFTNETFTTPALMTTTPYYVSVNDGTCESARAEVFATVLQLPSAPVAQQPAAICPGTTITLTASGGVDGNYRWYDGQTLLTGEVNSTLILNNVTVTKTYSVSIFNGTCESIKTPVAVTVQNCTPPVVASSVSTAYVEGLVVIDLEPLITDEENNVDASTLSISQQPESGAPATLSGFELTINYSGFAFLGTDHVGIEVCDLTSMCTEQQLTLELGGEITVYNAVSPNNDGLNDFFFVQYIDLVPETQSNTVYIYNRWGDEVFSVNNYNNSTNVFKGENNNGNKLPAGTYFYKIFINGSKTRSGFLSLKY